jgi:DNA-binding Lrp family transcriptional regulator
MMMTREDATTCESTEELDKLPRDYRAPALDKGLDIIELLVRAGRPMTLARISGRLNKSAPELFRMVRVLERREYIELPKGQTGYVLTDKLSRLGTACGDSKTLPDYYLPAMRRVRELEEENTKLRRVVAELLQDNAATPDFRSSTG